MLIVMNQTIRCFAPLRFVTFRSKPWAFVTFRSGARANAEASDQKRGLDGFQGVPRALRFEAYVSYVSGKLVEETPRFGPTFRN